MNATIQTKSVTKTEATFDGYAQITYTEFAGILRTFKTFLQNVCPDDCGLAAVYMLATTSQAFLYESNDGRFFVSI